MRATVIISLHGTTYRATVSGRFGGGYQNAAAGSSPEEAAAFAAREMVRYSQSNPEGGDLVAPQEVLALVPAHLHSVGGSAGPRCPHCGGEINPAALLGRSSSEAKAAAARDNAKKPRPTAQGKAKPRKPRAD